MVVPLVLFHHVLVEWLFLLYSTIIYLSNCCSARTLPSSTGPLVVPLVLYHHILSNGCSSCTPLSFIDEMVVPLLLYHHLLTNGRSFCTQSSSTDLMVVPLVFYHLLVTKWLFHLYSIIIYWRNVVLLVLCHHLLV